MLKTKLLGTAGLAAATVLSFGLLSAQTTTAQATPACPTILDSQVGGGGTTLGCNVLLTINSNGTVTASSPSGTTNYDGSDDALIGITNNTSKTLNHLLIQGSSAFGGSFGGMDGDGICDTSRFSGADCTGAVTTGSFNYAPAGITLTMLTAENGFVDIAGGLAPGESLYFSLEAPASIDNITVRTVPEPLTVSLVGAGLAGAVALRRRKKKPA